MEKKRYKSICEEFHLSPWTAKKYVQMNQKEIQALDHPTLYKKRKTVTDDFINMIYKMGREGILPEAIFSYVISRGYTGSWAALDHRINYLLKNNFGVTLGMHYYLNYVYPPEVTVLSRNEIIKRVSIKNEKKKVTDSEEYLKIIKKTYPVVDEIERIYKDFYATLMGADVKKLDDFIHDYKKSVLSSFVEGIEKDIAPIKNAISYPNSSGFVEGNNNKFKLIKRILYGRSGIVNLFRKCYLPFYVTTLTFN